MYLRQNVVAEPLVGRWYAWAYLVAPVQAAMYTANSHVKVMRSFVASPELHVETLKNPEMIGGPFINYPAERAPDVRRLLDETVAERAADLELARAVAALERLLGAELTGQSLEPLYERVPEPLRGFVELVYDLNNRPSFRLVEGLLYRSAHYDESRQCVSLFAVEGDERPFVFSTPRLEDDGRVTVRLPFRSEAYDELFRLRYEDGDPDLVAERCGVDPDDRAAFRALFADEPPRRREPFVGEGVRVRYFGHACVLVESRRCSVLTDPVVGYEHGHGSPRYSFADLPERIDYVLITHNHADHLMFETLLPLRHRIGTVVVPRANAGALADPSLKMLLNATGFASVVEIDELERIPVDGGAITGVPFFGEHCDLNVRTKSAYHVELEGRGVLFVADSNNVEPRVYEHVRGALGPVDALFVGLECDGAPLSWLYGPLASRPLSRKHDQSRRTNASDCARAFGIVERLSPSRVYVYAMGQEPWLGYVTSIVYSGDSPPIVESDRLVARCAERGIPAERLYGPTEMRFAPAVAASPGGG